MNKRHLSKVALLISSQFLAFTTQAESLEQVIAKTLATNPDIQSAYNEYMSRVAQGDVSEGNYLPSVDLEAGVGYEDYDNSLGTQGEFDPRYAQLSIRQLIWDGSSTYNDIQRTASEAEAQRYQLLSDAQDMALQTSEAYLKVLEAQELLTLTQANLDVHKSIVKDIQKRTDSGLSSTADLTQVEGRLARAQTNLISAQGNLTDQISNFMKLVGEYPEGLKVPDVDDDYLAVSIDDALAKAKENNPVLLVAKHDIDAAQSQYEQARGTLLPTFTVEGSQKWGDELDGSEGDTDELKVMLKMRYNLYNGGSDKAESRSAAYQVNKAKNIRDRAYRMLEESTRYAWNARELAEQQRKYLEQHVDLSAKTIIVYEKQYKLGKRTLLDLLNTENELFESRKEYISAYYNGLYANFRLLNSTGLLLDSFRVDLPQEWTESNQ
ncbi:TolC family outer membrane protein [Vibrio rumoiensis]|uniref:Agglutination protein n=1 Tax=Vibrio rumoiensis 1S-45 TaxID=1188252 RepID=A0A1E5DZM3_9VIBR|nr:TolC family outer membrane protein [Vibrio rumoiensis]OEF23302.1 agglutination protein [Vibrio rumoiensis 1S-45]